MIKAIPLSIVLLLFLASMSFGQTATRAEFEEYCKVWEGRWIGDVTWIADWPGLGKKGDKVTCYWEGRITADGNALSAVFYGGTGRSTGITYFDPGTKQIKGLVVTSGGTIFNLIFFKKDGKWQQHVTGNLPDGSKKLGVTKGSVVTYLGPHTDIFKQVFSEFGSVK